LSHNLEKQETKEAGASASAFPRRGSDAKASGLLLTKKPSQATR
jgi:hypothetical protein